MRKHVFVVLALAAALLAATVQTASAETMVAKNSTGQLKVLVLMIQFPDVRPQFSISRMKGKYFRRLNEYVREVSYDRARITGEAWGWYTLPKPVGSYKISQHNMSVDKGRVARLVQDAIDLADRDVDYSKYSFVIISLGAKRTDYGMMGLCGYPGMLGWQDTKPFKTKSGQVVPGGVAIYCEQAHLGVVFHDVVHILGGVIGKRRVVPCLYDHDIQAKKGSFRGYAKFYLTNVGYFDPMSCHFVKLREGPPGICSWTKLRLGWLPPERIVTVGPGREATVTLAPLSKQGSACAAIKIPIDRNTYYLVENRQPVGADRVLPASGVLVLFCDDRVAECRHSRSPVKAVPAKPEVPELNGAPYNIGSGEKDTFTDSKRGITIKLMGKSSHNYLIKVSRIR